MGIIKTFDELFPPESYQRKHSLVELGISKLDREINDIIVESYGISLRVIYIVENLVKQIKESIGYEEYEKISSDISTNDDFKYETYVLEQSMNVDGLVFDVTCYLMEYGDLNDDDFEFVSTMNTMARTKNLSSTRFAMTCYIPTRNFDIGKVGERLLNHEIMHAWQHHKKNIDKKEKEYPEWNKIYSQATNLLKDKVFDSEFVELISKSIYYGDLRELAAFTQQAYHDLKHISGDTDIVHKKMRKLEIYKGVNSIKDAIEYLENNDLPEVFDFDKNLLLKILKKRYYQYKKNIARLLLARKEVIEETMSYIDISKKELMMISR